MGLLEVSFRFQTIKPYRFHPRVCITLAKPLPQHDEAPTNHDMALPRHIHHISSLVLRMSHLSRFAWGLGSKIYPKPTRLAVSMICPP